MQAGNARFEVREVLRLERGPSIIFAGRILEGAIHTGMNVQFELQPGLYCSSRITAVEYIDRVSVEENLIGLVCSETDSKEAELYAELCPPGTIVHVKSPRLFADVTLYSTAQGGRNGPTPANWFGCPCAAVNDQSQAWDCRLLLGGTPLKPGDTRRVEVTFLSPEQAVPAFRASGRFFLWEGRVIGEGKLV